MEIPFEGQITQQDYLQAQSLHRELPKPLIISGGIFLAFLFIGTIVSAVLEPIIFRTALPMVAILAVVFGLVWWLPRFLAINNWKNSKAFQAPLSGTITSQSIHFTGKHFSSSVNWGVFTDFKRSPNILVLYQSPNTFNIFPKAFFKNEVDWNMLNEFVDRKVFKDTSQDLPRKVSYIAIGVIVVVAMIVSFINSINQ